MSDTRSGSERCPTCQAPTTADRYRGWSRKPNGDWTRCADPFHTPASPGDEGQERIAQGLDRVSRPGLDPDDPQDAAYIGAMTGDAQTCPTCGTPVELVSGSEGTNHYRPLGIDRSEVEHDLRQLRDWCFAVANDDERLLHVANQLEALLSCVGERR